MSSPDINIAKTTCEYLPDTDRVLIPRGARPRVLSVCFEPTNRCPGRCPYCLIEEHNHDESTTTLMDVLDTLIEHGTVRFGFGGGEPLLRPDLNELGRRVRRSGAGALLRTSGMFPMDPMVTRAAFDWVDLSFDSIEPGVFRSCRPGVPYDVLVANLLGLVRAAVRIRVSLLITARNLRTVEQTIQWLGQIGVKHIRLQRLVRRGQAKVTWRALAVDAETVDGVIGEMRQLGVELGIEVSELKTISTTTLCVVKGNGDCYSGEPDGITRRGTVFSPSDLCGIATRLFSAQTSAYHYD